MTNLRTKYMGLELANPIIVGSCGLTRNLDGVLKCAEAGAGAVVLKSIFEEQIAYEVSAELAAGEEGLWHPEALEYTKTYARENEIGKYLDLISAAKARAGLPVIASVHCVSAGAWPSFASRLAQAGADALELNLFVLPSDPRRDARAIEQVYQDVADAVRDQVRIPVALKLGTYFSGLADTARKLASGKVAALTLFNRFFSTDIDVERLELTRASHLSDPGEYVLPLRWISILHHRVDCDLCASTGAHDAGTVIKLILAGASAVQVVSALYKHGVSHIGAILEGLERWMAAHGFEGVDDFRGRLSQAHMENPAAWERVQFMKFAAGVE